jgi:hypothetical protein
MILRACVLLLCCAVGARVVVGQEQQISEEEFGPVVRAYLAYLRNEQEVVDDSVSRREVSRKYYVHNVNRIRALREIAIRIARESQNDYLPELEAVSRDEFERLFENPPKPAQLRVGFVVNNTFRFLGTVRAGEIFYIFARLDPYEQAELMEKEKRSSPPNSNGNGTSGETDATGVVTTRPRRATSPDK